MWDRLAETEKRYQAINRQMADPEISSDVKELQRLAQERAALEEVVTLYRQYLESRLENLETELKAALIQKDPNDDKNIIMEIRAGTGGDEAGLFAADLLRMYTRYAQLKGWEVEVLNASESGISVGSSTKEVSTAYREYR